VCVVLLRMAHTKGNAGWIAACLPARKKARPAAVFPRPLGTWATRMDITTRSLLQRSNNDSFDIKLEIRRRKHDSSSPI
jgi:hypothetical protein